MSDHPRPAKKATTEEVLKASKLLEGLESETAAIKINAIAINNILRRLRSFKRTAGKPVAVTAASLIAAFPDSGSPSIHVAKLTGIK